ncbi:MAG: pilus assembly protein [Firmicutes bacterium]|nr:pilus assembly protein [Bacillota bacterium]
MVEAALVFPLVVLIIAGVIGLSLRILAETKTDALRHREEAREALDPRILSTENIMRGVWTTNE